MKNLKQKNEILPQRCGENEQYGRRFCGRITGIPSQKNESTEDVWNSVKPIIEESGCDIPDIALDRAHRFGKNDPSGKNVRLVIVRFTTFRHRKMFYGARKNLSKNGIYFDLTKKRLTACQKARNLVKSKKFVKYVYVDVNCRSKVKFENNKESFFFSSLSELIDLTDQKITLVSSDMELKQLMWVKICKTKSCLYRCFFFRLLIGGH